MLAPTYPSADAWLSAVESEVVGLSTTSGQLPRRVLQAVARAEAEAADCDGFACATAGMLAAATGLDHRTVMRARLLLTELSLEVLLEPSRAVGPVRRQLQVPSHRGSAGER